MAELVLLNKDDQLTSDSYSVNGQELFEAVSKLIAAYGNEILALESVPEHLRRSIYKGTWICLTILCREFNLALNVAIQMATSIPEEDILTCRKLTKAYFQFMKYIFDRDIAFKMRLQDVCFNHIVLLMKCGLKDWDPSISLACASVLENLARFYINKAWEAAPRSFVLTHALLLKGSCSSLLKEILKILFKIVLSDEECETQHHSLIFELIVMDPEMLFEVEQEILESQLADQRDRLSVCFNELMKDVGKSLTKHNKALFRKNLDNHFFLPFWLLTLSIEMGNFQIDRMENAGFCKLPEKFYEKVEQGSIIIKRSSVLASVNNVLFLMRSLIH